MNTENAKPIFVSFDMWVSRYPILALMTYRREVNITVWSGVCVFNFCDTEIWGTCSVHKNFRFEENFLHDRCLAFSPSGHMFARLSKNCDIIFGLPPLNLMTPSSIGDFKKNEQFLVNCEEEVLLCCMWYCQTLQAKVLWLTIWK